MVFDVTRFHALSFKMQIFQIISYLTSVETTDRLSKFVNDEQTYHSQYYNPKFSIKINFGTSHLSIIAPNGDAVSVTSSINY